MISAGSLVDTAKNLLSRTTEPQHALSVQRWLDEMIWREFYQSAIYHFPESSFRSLRQEFEAIEWNEDGDELEAWKQGRTGYPIVDAAMRQLESVGWIHNRLRMIVASFLVKHLLIDWRVGAQWFMKKLIDGELAANTGGWQWIAGTGLDASPYFRIFNPILQGKKFDPNGTYVRTWIPELGSVPDNKVHSPWEWAGGVSGYPMPIVNHAFARGRAIAAYKGARDRFRANSHP
jgi:deoxyribodipyrimidine photo-lyase